MNGPVGAEPVGELELVHSFTGPMPTGVAVSHTGRIFVNFPQWGDEPPAALVEVRDGREVPFPDERWNSPKGDDDAQAFVSVQNMVVDPVDRLWVVDTGSPMFRPTRPGGPKLVRIDLDTNTVAQVITFPSEVALPTTYLNDVRFDLRRGSAGLAYLTDSAVSGPNGIVVVDLGTGRSWRRLHDHPSTTADPLHAYLPIVEGRPLMSRPPDGPPQALTIGSDGIAICADGSRLYYSPLMSRRWHSVATDALADASMPEEEVSDTVIDEGDKGTGSDGLESDDAGRLYLTAYEHNAVLRRLPDGQFETLLHDPRLLWPDTMVVAVDRHLYVTANQLHRQPSYQGGRDLRRKPYALFRTPIDAGPVLLR
ncbi:L-dopachrome tautomerase-related protein [Micromonospora sp. WMMD812]|uniref:L-dopachrome tautomerase-related protein n=1 Tax=Micromonospora sp. WMMD812 TaxID=3015152 RepID=UPI00248C42CD|nr:L-dopachrome tautomerase-related protein [Micromonospora sp. WMMD812]WBB68061.1 L-dopachrome tautomerase-related protein [Micromonospora sp. WMMD812]